MEANTCENAYFRMPNYVLSKAATPMNSHFERTLFTSKFCMDKTPSKYGAHFQIHPGTNLSNNVWQNLRQLLMRTLNFQSMLHGKLNTLEEKSCTFVKRCKLSL